MSKHYEVLEVTHIEPFEIEHRIYEAEDDPDMFVDYTQEELDELYDNINKGNIHHFIYAVVVKVNGIELGMNSVGGCLYANPRDVIFDYGDYLVNEALLEAKNNLNSIVDKVKDFS